MSDQIRDGQDEERGRSLSLMAELAGHNEVLGSLAFSSTTGLFEQDSLNGLTWANENWVAITGMSLQESLGDGWRVLMDPAEMAPERSLGVAPVGREAPVRIRITRPDGEQRWLDLRSSVIPPDEDGVIRRVGGIEDVTAVVESEAARGRLTAVFDATDDLVVLFTPDRELVYANRAAREFLGSQIELLATDPQLAEVAEAVTVAVEENGKSSWRGEISLEGIDGWSRPLSLEVLLHQDDRGELDYVSVTGRDISERIALQQSLEYQATHDALTGLPNRSMLFDRIRVAALETEPDPNHFIALLFIDLDHFKIINDSLGHSLGDQLLQAIARRIGQVVRPEDLVGRFGGDEFVVLCEWLTDRQDAVAVARRVETALEEPFLIDNHAMHVGVSIGIAYAGGILDPEAILRDADTAMYEAKSAGRGRQVVFDDELRRKAVGRQQTESELRSARNGEDLEVHYQPVMDLRSRTIRGAEALLRWNRAGRLVPPAEFVNVAEESGLIVPIGRWVLEEACRRTAQWQQIPGRADLGVAVNVSARQLQRQGFAAMVAGVLESTGLAAGTLTIEITETVLLEEEEISVEVLHSLHDMGVRIAIDDFGTGYSSLTYLHRLPVDTVKLDYSFVAGVADDIQKRAIVTAVINLAKALGLQSVAEGIETERELAELRILGCDAGQGHLISRSILAEEFGLLLTEGVDGGSGHRLG